MHEIFFNHQWKCVEGESGSILYLKIKLHFSCCPLFFKYFLNLQDQ